jgi:maltoporin
MNRVYMNWMVVGWAMVVLAIAPISVVSAQDDQRIGELETRIAKLEEEAQKAPDVDSGFEFTGYGRAGFSMNSSGGAVENDSDGQPFILDGAGSKWRLGNESDTYVELKLNKKWALDDGTKARLMFMPVFKEFNDRDWKVYGDDEGSEAKLTFRQAFAEIDNPFGKEMSFWAGKRFYRRNDIHPIDFYYTQRTGYGGGVQDISLAGQSKLAVAWLNQSRGSDLVTDEGEFTINNLYVDLYDIMLGPGKLSIQLGASKSSGGTYLDTSTNTAYRIESFNGFEGTFQYSLTDTFFGIGKKGSSVVFAQYGDGASVNFNAESGISSYTAANSYNPGTDPADIKRYRVGAFGLLQLTDQLSLMPVLVCEMLDNGNDSDNIKKWVTAGFRGKYSLTDHLALQFDYGYDWVDDDADNDTKYMHKVSFAPTITMGSDFWARPELRAYVTYATWSEEGDAGGSTFSDETSGLIYGVQMEVWW